MSVNYIDLMSANYIVWENYGCEGWQPKLYANLNNALNDIKYNSEWVVTKIVKYDVLEKE